MSREQIVRILDGISDLPTLPTVYMRLNRLLQSSKSNTTQIAKIIESDQAIASKVLRLVNSSFFGFSRRVTQISHAVVLLGFNAIRNAVLSISVFESFENNRRSQFDRREFWKHSIATGILARTLAKELKVGNEEEAFSGGILHDLGKLVLDQYLSKKFELVLQASKEQNCTILEAERLVLGTDHCEIGEYLTERWSLPHVLVEMVALHHSPSVIRSNPQLVSVVHLSDVLARRFGIGSGGDPLVPEVDAFALDELSLEPDKLDTLLPVLESHVQESEDLLSLVN